MNHTILPFELPTFKLNLPGLLPVRRESVAQQVPCLTARYLDEWWACDEHLPAFRASYTPRQWAQNEQRCTRLLDALETEMKRMRRAVGDADAIRQRLLDDMFDFARQELGAEAEDLEMVRSAGFLDLAAGFVRQAQRFDPHISGADIFQANRNVLSMGYLQFLLDLPVQLTPSIFAYSMLYPYSDNLLDDPSISYDERRTFNLRFRRRLEGEILLESSRLEGRIWQLVAMVEGQYPRVAYPQVYESLLAIHAAQGKSMHQSRSGAGPYELDVLGISIEKGGTSTLADGYLVAGDLTEDQAAACFGYGAFTQLMDDLEDLAEDRKAGFQTLFSQLAGNWKLDGVTTRAMRFAGGIIHRMQAFPNPQAPRLADNMHQAVQALFAFSAGSQPAFYSREFLEELQRRRLPLRFPFLEKQRRRMAKRGLGVVELMLALSGK